jgi:hypothetical protein
MKVKCISKISRNLPEQVIYPDLGLGPDRVFSLVIGKDYVVYGLTSYLGIPWFFICDEDYSYYPIWNPSPLFRIIDDRLSALWRIGIYGPGKEKDLPVLILAFEEWVNNPFFYDQLTNGDDSAVRVFKERKQQMDREFDV